MINKPSGYDEAQIKTALPKLPAGGYIVRVLNIKKESTNYGDVLVFQIDIAEGPEAGFYRKNYELQTQEDKKWKGTIRVYVPGDDAEEWQLASFKKTMTCFEDANEGYTWNWDETTLKGKICGALFRNKEFELNNGTRGWYTQGFMFYNAEQIREGNYNMPQDKSLEGNGTYNSNSSGSDSNDYAPANGYGETPDDDIPF